MPANYSPDYRPAYAELPGKRIQAFAGSLPLSSLSGSDPPAPPDLFGCIARQLRVRPTLLIDVLGHWFEMFRIDASACSTPYPATSRVAAIFNHVPRFQRQSGSSHDPILLTRPALEAARISF